MAYDPAKPVSERERDSDAVYCDCDAVVQFVRDCKRQLEERKLYLGSYSTCPGGHDIRLCDTGLDGLDEVITTMEAERDDVAERVLAGERSAA